MIVPVGPIAPGASARVVVPLYAGPQDQDNLQSVAPGLELAVDYGWLTVIAAPLFWVLKLFHGWMGNWGLAIILLTVVIKLICAVVLLSACVTTTCSTCSKSSGVLASK